MSACGQDTKKQHTKEIIIRNEKLRSEHPSVSSMSVHGATITTVSPDIYSIPQKNIKYFQKFRLHGIKLLKNQTTQV